MTEEVAPRDEVVPPPGEQVHLPGPSFLPVFVAFGLTLALAGIIVSWFIFAIGLLFFLVPAIRWVREARQEMAELPLEH